MAPLSTWLYIDVDGDDPFLQLAFRGYVMSATDVTCHRVSNVFQYDDNIYRIFVFDSNEFITDERNTEPKYMYELNGGDFEFGYPIVYYDINRNYAVGYINFDYEFVNPSN